MKLERPLCRRCHTRPCPKRRRVCSACRKAAAPPPPPSGVRLKDGAEPLARKLEGLATEAEVLGARGSAERLRELAAYLRDDPSRVGAVLREVAATVERAALMVKETRDGEIAAVWLLWKRAS